jgi:arylsulfatase A-like enzyme
VRSRTVRALLGVAGAGLLVGGGLVFANRSSSGGDSERPNVVLIVTDDQRWDSMAEMPKVDALPGWARFENAFVNDPQCCPSRASILTGRYTQHTGVETLRQGDKLDESRTIATMLDDAGYRTGFFGKYLNGYPFGRGHYVPPGWDVFGAYEGATEYFDYRLNEKGTVEEYGHAEDDYSTDVFAAKSRQFIRSTKASEPLFLEVAPNAPHWAGNIRAAVPAPRDAGSCADRTFELRANFNGVDTVSEPAWMAHTSVVAAPEQQKQFRLNCETLQSVDDMVIAIIDELRRAGRAGNTYIVFTSDNGFSFGEHRLIGKGHLYEESIRVPLFVRGPGIASRTVSRLTSNVDILPTVLDWAGVDPPKDFVDGTSFASAAAGDAGAKGPDEVLLRGCRTSRDNPAPDCGGYVEEMGLNWGLRTATHKLIENADGSVQLFDLRRDPFELTNLESDPAQTRLKRQLRARLSQLRSGELGFRPVE